MAGTQLALTNTESHQILTPNTHKTVTKSTRPLYKYTNVSLCKLPATRKSPCTRKRTEKLSGTAGRAWLKKWRGTRSTKKNGKSQQSHPILTQQLYKLSLQIHTRNPRTLTKHSANFQHVGDTITHTKL